MGKFEERLWSVVRNFLSISRENPALLVTAVQIIELQELVDAQLRSVGGQGKPSYFNPLGARQATC